MSRGIVLLHEDGKTFEMAPLQVFIGANGHTLIRIGRNMLFFNPDGRFDGTECKTGELDTESTEAKMLLEAFELQGEAKGLPPEEAYFQPGSPGYKAETRAWPRARYESDGGTTYGITQKKPTGH